MSKSLYRSLRSSVPLALMVAVLLFGFVNLAVAKGSKDEPASTKGPVTIKWLAYQTAGQPDPNSAIVKQVEQKFNVKFDFWFIDDQKWDDVLNVKFAAGEMPDVMRIKNTNNIGKYVDMGILAELPEADIRKYAPNYAAAVDKYNQSGMLWNATKYKGKNYGFTMVAIDGLYPSVLEWRTDWLKNVGINKIPSTLAEFEDAMYKFRNDDPDKNGKKDTYGMSSTAMMAVFGAFGVLENGKAITGNEPMTLSVKNDRVVFNAIQPEAKEALALLAKWYKDGVIDPEFVTGENKGGYWALSHAFMNNKVGVTGQVYFYHYSPPNTAEGAKGGPCYVETVKLNPSATFAPAIAPVGPTGKSGTDVQGGVGEKFGISSAAIKDPAKVKAIMSMVDAIFSDEAYSKLVSWGVEGTDYTVVNGNLQRTAAAAAELRNKGVGVFFFLSGSADLYKKMMPSRYEYAEKFAKGPGYARPIVPSTEAFSKNSETLKKLFQQAYIDIITGVKPVSYFDTFVKDFRTNGGDETEAAMTKAYNSLFGK